MNHVRRNTFVIAIALLWWCGASPATAQVNLDALADNPKLFLETARKFFRWEEPTDPARIAGPIYFVGTRGLAVYLITTSEGHIVINSGMPGSGPMIEASIRKLGFKPEEIKILLVGHAHIDHAGGHAYLKKISGAKNCVIREEKDLFESGGKLDFHYGKNTEFEFDPVKADTVFNDGDTIKLGDVSIKVLLTNGHTRGSTTFVMDIVEDGKKYNVIFPNGTSVNPGYRLIKDPSYPGIKDDLARTLGILADMKPDIWLMAHTEAFHYETKLARYAKEGVSVWVDPEGYKKWLVTARERFQAAVDKEMGVTPKK